MKNFDIYKNDKAKLLTGFSTNYEEFKEKTGKYPINGLLIVLIGKENPLSIKIMKAENFILKKDEKKLLCSVLEKHIDPQIKDFRNGNPQEDPCVNAFYKGAQYFANTKGATNQKERDILSAVGLYNCFNDPDDNDIVEIRYNP